MGLIGRIVDRTHESCDGIVETFPITTDPDDAFVPLLSLAGTQKIQAGLPADTALVWRAVAKRWPKLDGLGAWGDRSHQSRVSCHNFNTGKPGVVGPKAVDCMTKDLILGAQVAQWALISRQALGITLIIHNRTKWSAATGWKPRPYRGTSPHTDHVHLSVHC